MHKKHRERVKQRFIEQDCSFKTFPDHNILEMLLFYGIPQKDTNDLAHLLINTFGSVSKVFDADIEELKRVNGIGEHSSILLKMIPALAKCYIDDRGRKEKVFETEEQLGEYFVRKYIGANREIIMMLLLDNKRAPIDCIELSQGMVNTVSFDAKFIVEKAVTRRASSVVIAHNHPRGNATPSREDMESTEIIKRSLGNVGVNLLEHIVVAEDTYFPIMRYLSQNGNIIR